MRIHTNGAHVRQISLNFHESFSRSMRSMRCTVSCRGNKLCFYYIHRNWH